MSEDRLITVAIYTYEKAQIIKGYSCRHTECQSDTAGCIIGGTDSYSGKRSAACP